MEIFTGSLHCSAEDFRRQWEGVEKFRSPGGGGFGDFYRRRIGRPLWGHPVGHDDPACRRRAGRPAGGAKDAWRHLGMYSFQIKRIHPQTPEEKFWGRFDSAPRPLLRPKGASAPFGNPGGGTRDGGRGSGPPRSSAPTGGCGGSAIAGETARGGASAGDGDRESGRTNVLPLSVFSCSSALRLPCAFC